MSIDIQGYGGRDDRRQEDVQSDLRRMLSAAAGAAGLDRSGWYVQGAGDSELALVPLDGTEPRVLDDYVRQINQQLTRYNDDRRDTARMRLRVAAHQGVGYQADNGFAGAAVVTVSRLRDSPAAYAALAGSPGSHLALIVSDSVYQDVIQQGHTTYCPEEFALVEVALKELTTRAWVWTPGPQPLTLATGPEQAIEPGMQCGGNAVAQAAAGEAVAQAGRDLAATGHGSTVVHFHGQADNRGAVIGVNLGTTGGGPAHE